MNVRGEADDRRDLADQEAGQVDDVRAQVAERAAARGSPLSKPPGVGSVVEPHSCR